MLYGSIKFPHHGGEVAEQTYAPYCLKRYLYFIADRHAFLRVLGYPPTQSRSCRRWQTQLSHRYSIDSADILFSYRRVQSADCHHAVQKEETGTARHGTKKLVAPDVNINLITERQLRTLAFVLNCRSVFDKAATCFPNVHGKYTSTLYTWVNDKFEVMRNVKTL